MRGELLPSLRVALLLRPAAAACGPESAFPPTADEGPETAALTTQEGRWSVTENFWPKPGADPQMSTRLVADRPMLRTEKVISHDGSDHETKDQYFVLADGSGVRWPAHRYDYWRQR